MITGSSLVGEVTGKVKTLSRFPKGRKEPDSHGSANARWVEEMGNAEVSVLATQIHEKIRASLGYRRKEVSFNVDGAAASILTPDFDLNITLIQHPKDAAMYRMTTEICHFRRPEVVGLAEFSDAFSPYCDRVVIDLAKPLDIEGKIDEIEEVESFRRNLQYDAECTNFTLKLPEFGLILHAVPARMEFTQVPRGELSGLVSRTTAALAHLAASSVTVSGQD